MDKICERCMQKNILHSEDQSKCLTEEMEEKITTNYPLKKIGIAIPFVDTLFGDQIDQRSMAIRKVKVIYISNFKL